MKQKKIKLHITTQAIQAQLYEEEDCFAIKEIDHKNVTYIYTLDDVKTIVNFEEQSVGLMRIDQGISAVWMNEFKEGLLFKSTPYGSMSLALKLNQLDVSDDGLTLSYHIMDQEEITETITLTWEEL